MRYKETIISGNGKEVYVLVLGKEELQLILGMSERLKRELPKSVFETAKPRARLTGIIRTIRKIFNNKPWN